MWTESWGGSPGPRRTSPSGLFACNAMDQADEDVGRGRGRPPHKTKGHWTFVLAAPRLIPAPARRLVLSLVHISLFITCYNDTLFPRTGRAVVAVLERLGHTIEFRQAQTCCGQMHYNTGYQAEAMPLMRHFLEVFRDDETICIPSSSCVAMIRDHYPKMAAASGDSAVARAVEKLLPRIFEFSELLVDKLGVTDVGAFFPHSVTLHPSCHSLRSLHLGDKPERLLKQVRG